MDEETSETSLGEEGSFSESEDVENDEEYQESKDDNKNRGRDKRECPIPSCDSRVVHLPRHLRNVHKWRAVHARTAVSRLGLRKKYLFSNDEKAKAGNRKVKKETTEKKVNGNLAERGKFVPSKAA